MKKPLSLENSKSWNIPEGTLIHIAGMPYETVGEVKVYGFHAPEKMQQKAIGDDETIDLNRG